jgi:hypothetical protein
MKRAVLAVVLVALFAPPVTAQVRQTDREFDGLRGPVKTVTDEEAELKDVAGESVEQARVLRRSVAYDAAGNWAESKEYDYKGNLFQTLLFSFVGNDRVARAELAGTADSIVVELPARRGPSRVDPRYTYKFKYKYGAGGKRVEESWYHSDGSFYLKQVYKLAGNRKVFSVYDASGALNQRETATLDEKGNESVKLIRDTFADKVAYKYVEFDSHGNWTKRVKTRGFKHLSASDFATIKPWSIEYRTITYH